MEVEGHFGPARTSFDLDFQDSDTFVHTQSQVSKLQKGHKTPAERGVPGRALDRHCLQPGGFSRWAPPWRERLRSGAVLEAFLVCANSELCQRPECGPLSSHAPLEKINYNTIAACSPLLTLPGPSPSALLVATR